MDKMTIIFLIFLAFSILFFIIMIICGKHEKEKRDAIEPIEKSNKFETIEKTVKVIDLACQVRMVGTKQPKSVREFFVLFEEPDKSTFQIAVSEEFYDGFEIGQVGVLTLVDGEVYSFIPF